MVIFDGLWLTFTSLGKTNQETHLHGIVWMDFPWKIIVLENKKGGLPACHQGLLNHRWCNGHTWWKPRSQRQTIPNLSNPLKFMQPSWKFWLSQWFLAFSPWGNNYLGNTLWYFKTANEHCLFKMVIFHSYVNVYQMVHEWNMFNSEHKSCRDNSHKPILPQL